MPYKITGNTTENARFIIFNQAWTIESNNIIYNSDYAIDTTSGTKTLIVRNDNGQVLGFGNITPVLIDEADPVITISSPTSNTTYATTDTTITLQGAASDDSAVNSVRWVNTTTAVSGTATGTTSWQTSAISLVLGSNTLNVYATDIVGKIGTDTLTVTRNPAYGDRGVFIGGSSSTRIDYITISTTGNAITFGATGRTDTYGSAGSSNGLTGRGLIGGGGSSIKTIQYITIMTPGNLQSFGDLTQGRANLAGTSNGTNNRGIWGGGDAISWDAYIDYVTISTAGNAASFGNLTQARYKLAGTSNGTNNRGIFAGGGTYFYSWTYYNIIDYVTISSASSATDFGDMHSVEAEFSAVSNGTNNRAVMGGSFHNDINDLCYCTISTLGNAAAFGDLTVSVRNHSGTSNSIGNRGVFAAGNDLNVIQYITITTTGNTTDFGDLTTTFRDNNTAVAN